MPIQVASNIIPKSGAKWPVVEDIYVKGGLRVVADAATRDSLYTDTTAKLGLKTGMLLITASDSKIWQYAGLGVWIEVKKTVAYTYTQDTPSDLWLISHGANSSHFTYTLFDAEGYQILPSECHILDVNNLEVSFASPIAGHATFFFDV